MTWPAGKFCLIISVIAIMLMAVGIGLRTVANTPQPNPASMASLKAAKPGDLIIFPDKSGKLDFDRVMIVWVDAAKAGGSDVRVKNVSFITGEVYSLFIEDLARQGATVVAADTMPIQYNDISKHCLRRIFGPPGLK